MSFLQGENEATFDDHNGDAMETIVEQSKRYPSLLLEAYGTGEDKEDIYKVRIQNGKKEPVDCRFVYPTFKNLLTPTERKAARWKASRHSKCTVAMSYDPRVGRALRLMQDLLNNPPACNRPTDRPQMPSVDLYPAVELLEQLKRNMMLSVNTED